MDEKYNFRNITEMLKFQPLAAEPDAACCLAAFSFLSASFCNLFPIQIINFGEDRLLPTTDLYKNDVFKTIESKNFKCVKFDSLIIDL
jgi:hypothetical protein